MNTESQPIDQASNSAQPPRLPHPLRITEQSWPEGTVPVVSIWCITYQHVNLIRDAIEGFLMQETTFPVEILIHDDASTDGTADIVREYQAKHPQLIRTVLQTENQYSKGIKPRQFLDPLVRGEFIALCDGDDYWISPHKLQKQVRILEQDPTVALVFHNAWTKHEESRRDYFLNQGIDKSRFTLDEIVERDWFMATASIVFRRNPPLPPEITRYSMVGDMLIQLAACRTGEAVYLDEVSSVYRRHEGGVSEELWKGGDFHYEKFRPNNIWMYWLLRERVFSVSCHEAVERRIRNIVDKILGYAVLRKGMSRNHTLLRNYLFKVVCDNKPECVREEAVRRDGSLWLIMESQFRAFWKKHRKRQIQNFVRKVTNAIER